MNKNIIAFRKGLVICPNDHQDNRIDVATANAELMQFGYMLTESAFEALSKSDPSFIKEWTQDVIRYVADRMADGVWNPLHKGYPESVMNKPMMNIYMEQLLHYWSNSEWEPNEELADNGYTWEHVQYKTVYEGNDETFGNIFTALVQVNQSITPDDMKIIEWFADNCSKEELKSWMPKTIPFKENLTVLAAKGLPVPVKTPTDVLRIANYMSKLPTSLVIPPKKVKESQWSRNMVVNPEYLKYRMKNFNASERRYLLGLLEKVAYVQEMASRKQAFLVLGTVLRPGNYAKQFPNAFKAFDTLRNKKVRTWNGQVDIAFNKSLAAGLTKLSERPGEYARRLDSLVRKAKNEAERALILNTFRKSAIKVSNKVLFELFEYYKERNKDKQRSVWIKGARKPTPLPMLPKIKEDVIEEVDSTIWSTLSDKFAELEPLGSVWIDEELKNIPAPTNMRSLSDSLVTVIRGQRIKLQADKKVLRAYMHWHVGWDLDLSVEFYNKDKNERTVCAYHNQRPHPQVLHSGDRIPRTRGNWAEYVDIDIDKPYFDYALMVVHVFSGGGLVGAEATFGFMERDSKTSNAAWYPKTVTNAIKPTSTATDCAVILIDLKKKEWMLIDEDTNSSIPIARGNLIKHYVERVAELPEISAWHILKMHAEARGRVVADPEDADVLFKLEDFSTSYEKLLEYML